MRRGDVVAAVGAGGKTSLVYGLAGQAHRAGWRVLVTTTTHMGTLPETTTGPVFVEAEGDGEDALRRALERDGRATLLGRRIRPDKLAGISPERVDGLTRLADLVLVEADGARGRSLKLPAAHEPVLPGSTSLLVVLAALDAIGRPLDAGCVHRPERVAEAVGRPQGSILDAEAVAAALAAPGGYPAHRPAGGRTAVLLNKAEGDEAQRRSEAIAAALTPLFDRVAAGSVREGWVRVLA